MGETSTAVDELEQSELYTGRNGKSNLGNSDLFQLTSKSNSRFGLRVFTIVATTELTFDDLTFSFIGDIGS